jgi:hypothetical protein
MLFYYIFAPVINTGYKNNVKYRPSIVIVRILLILTIVLLTSVSIEAQVKARTLTTADTILPKKTILLNSNRNLKADTVLQPDSTGLRSFKISKDSIDSPVSYNAADSGVMIMATKEFFLYGDAKTVYKTSELEAANIVYDQTSQNIRAYGAKDTSGNPMSNPKFKEGTLS